MAIRFSLSHFSILLAVWMLFLSLAAIADDNTSNNGVEQISFPSNDGIEVTADLYLRHGSTAPFIILFHQANSSRGEYTDIAPRLNELGFNCLAVDLRSGLHSNGKPNQTKNSALNAGKSVTYIGSAPDVIASFNIVRNKYAKGKILVWGSSYSASLVLLLEGKNEIQADGVLSFSPGEYFGTNTIVTSVAPSIVTPVFITSASNERNRWWKIYQAIPPGKKSYFLPVFKVGRHGSSTLFADASGQEEYWQAVENFLEQFLQVTG